MYVSSAISHSMVLLNSCLPKTSHSCLPQNILICLIFFLPPLTNISLLQQYPANILCFLNSQSIGMSKPTLYHYIFLYQINYFLSQLQSKAVLINKLQLCITLFIRPTACSKMLWRIFYYSGFLYKMLPLREKMKYVQNYM